MKLTTMETVAGRMNEETLGSVRGVEFTTTEELAFGLNLAKAKMKNDAVELGADAIVEMSLEIFEISDGLFRAVASGIAMQTSALPMNMPIFNRAANDDDTLSHPHIVRPKHHAVSHMMH
jgi:predicted RNA-binding Zn ribbon-like protein